MVFSFKNLLRGVGVKKAVGRRGFPRTLNKATLWADTGNDIVCPASKWVRVGEYTIPAQQEIRVGYGVSGGNPEEMGHVYFDIYDDTATNSVVERGYLRLGQTNANETISRVLWEGRSEELDSSTTRSEQIPMPEFTDLDPLLTREDSKIFVDFKSDSADTVVETAIGTASTKNVWQLPITVYQ